MAVVTDIKKTCVKFWIFFLRCYERKIEEISFKVAPKMTMRNSFKIIFIALLFFLDFGTVFQTVELCCSDFSEMF